MSKRLRKERFSPEQKNWIARARAAPLKAAAEKTRAIISKLHATQRRRRDV